MNVLLILILILTASEFPVIVYGMMAKESVVSG